MFVCLLDSVKSPHLGSTYLKFDRKSEQFTFICTLLKRLACFAECCTLVRKESSVIEAYRWRLGLGNQYAQKNPSMCKC